MAKVKVWAIKTKRGEIALPTIRSSKRICIRSYMDDPGNRKFAWRELKRCGWDCVPVTLVQQRSAT